MKNLDELIYEALIADESLMAIVGGRVVSTCFAIPPDREDNTELPNIIVTDDGFTNNMTTKDYVWEGCEDQVQVSVDIAATSPNEVKQIMRKVRKAVEDYMVTLTKNRPELINLSAGELAWDWMKPCYHKTLIYQCITQADIEYEQED